MQVLNKLLLITLLYVTLFQTAVMAKRVKMTFYWIAKEGDHSGSKSIDLRTCSGQTIAKVSRSFAEAARMEGTARLNNGKVVNLACGCGSGYSCFMTLDQKRYPYGLGSRSNSLKPFISISANDLPYGSKVMVNQLKGLKMPNGSTHNGCVRVDDKGWSFGNNHIDLLVGDKKYYEQIARTFGSRLDHVDISVTSCQLQG
ncbi:hypothetical protein K493DRAFT_321172 [Basidiobolus meristosporus CBS 931.73]|uniref:3D domain-containing protein n=1 Tax=Basidiobolus meristosporus CBS 931.73 TaxID=1314790 RepID=A0A1Y1WYT3_9FUNG|nr:hypothetical protein K493DRAFT_321172 [Basidiobolus meristosporus CBS 931.73]|eukprot:ORX78737.1 hypothetical protein K493DRAFT_321172 [Basidiobolus meristosporus CBS 931.73]